MAVSKPKTDDHDGNDGNGFSFEDLKAVLRRKCRVYFAAGEDIEDIEGWLTHFRACSIPSDVIELYRTHPIFVPFGMLNADHGKIEGKQMVHEVDFHILPGRWAFDLELYSVRVDPATIEYFESAEGREPVTLLFVPDDGDTGTMLMVIMGLTLIKDRTMPTSGKELGQVTYRSRFDCENLDDRFILRHLEEDEGKTAQTPPGGEE